MPTVNARPSHAIGSFGSMQRTLASNAISLSPPPAQAQVRACAPCAACLTVALIGLQTACARWTGSNEYSPDHSGEFIRREPLTCAAEATSRQATVAVAVAVVMARRDMPAGCWADARPC